MDVQWLDGQPNTPGIVEKICPMRHLRQNQWRSEWNQMFLAQWSPWTYDYISDYDCIFNHPIDHDTKTVYIDSSPARWANLQAAKQQGMSISITNLAHFTNPIVAETIIESGFFSGGLKKINEDTLGHDIKAKLSWWSPIFTPANALQVRGTLGAAITPFLGLDDNPGTLQTPLQKLQKLQTLQTLQNQFATSDAFLPNPLRYGHSYFQYDINDLCQCYSNYVGEVVQFKILGTFAYKQEIMHAVLVCGVANGAALFGAYPLVPHEDVSAVVTRDAFGNWIWKPQATGTVITRLDDQRFYPMYRRWENVAFAFHIPDICVNDAKTKQNMFVVTQLGNNLHYLQPP